MTVVAMVAAMVAGTAALTWASGAIQGPATTSAASIQSPAAGNPLVGALLGRMTLAEKLRLLEWVTAPGQQGATLPGSRRLGIPALHLAEGPPGTARRPSAAMTAPLGVAATFSRADAYANGVVLGRDARALGQQAVARPFGAIDTGAPGAPPGASFGEDPLLAGGTAAAEVSGIQAQGTMAVADGYPPGPGGTSLPRGSGRPRGSAGSGGPGATGAPGVAGGPGAPGAPGATGGPGVTGGSGGPGGSGVVPSSTALHEIYLQPVEDAVRAGAAGVLCSPVGPATPSTAPGAPGGASTGGAAGSGAAGPGTAPGAPAATEPVGRGPCGNPGLLIQILRSELGFTGFVLAGPGANPGTLSLDSGLDGEIPAAGRAAARYFTPAALRAAIASKTITTATVNQAAAAVLTEMDRFGLLGPRPAHRAAAPPAAAPQAAADAPVISRTATDAATLLRDSGHALPLTPAALSSLALIGPGADQVIGAGPAGGTGAGTATAGTGAEAATGTTAGTGTGATAGAAPGTTAGIAAQPPGTLQALRQDLPPSQAARLTFAVGDDTTGTPVPAAALTHEGEPGLDRSAAGRGAARVVSTLDNTVAGHNPLPAGSRYSWSGELTVPAAGTYWIGLGTGGSWGTLTLDGAVIARDVPGSATAPVTGTSPAGAAPAGPAPVPTTDGLENLRAEVTLASGTHTLGVSEAPDGSGRPVQVRLDWVTPARQQASLAAAVANARAARAAVVFAWSGGGATLPDGQDQLIQDVAAVNPDTIVVLNTPGPVAMPWLGAVRAVLEMWYPGEAGGAATANVLLGRADPAGRLPVTWPASPRRFRRNQPTGIFVGYRRFDKDGIAPLFPFGYGLSYTRFGYSALNWHAAPGGGLVVRFRVTNAGPRAGATVPQVYLGAPASGPPGIAFAPRALAAYTRIGLRPGESRVVTLTVPERQLQYWQDARGWVTAPGPRPLYVGGDERASALSATVTIPR